MYAVNCCVQQLNSIMVRHTLSSECRTSNIINIMYKNTGFIVYNHLDTFNHQILNYPNDHQWLLVSICSHCYEVPESPHSKNAEAIQKWDGQLDDWVDRQVLGSGTNAVSCPSRKFITVLLSLSHT